MTPETIEEIRLSYRAHVNPEHIARRHGITADDVHRIAGADVAPER